MGPPQNTISECQTYRVQGFKILKIYDMSCVVLQFLGIETAPIFQDLMNYSFRGFRCSVATTTSTSPSKSRSSVIRNYLSSGLCAWFAVMGKCRDRSR